MNKILWLSRNLYNYSLDILEYDVHVEIRHMGGIHTYLYQLSLYQLLMQSSRWSITAWFFFWGAAQDKLRVATVRRKYMPELVCTVLNSSLNKVGIPSVFQCNLYECEFFGLSSPGGVLKENANKLKTGFV